MRPFPSDIAFTPAVKALQSQKGSRPRYARIERSEGWQTQVTADLAEFLAGLDMFYLGTANAQGQPYIQYRGGSPGFLKVIDETSLGSPTSPGTANMSRSATSRKTRKHSSS